MAKFLLLSVSLVLVGYSLGAAVNDNNVELKCLPKRSFAYDHNKCNCNEDGTEILCERKLYSTLTPILLESQLEHIEKECTPGERIEEHCRNCICDNSGKHANCLHSFCSDTSEDKFGKVDACIPGTVFSDNCNMCICGTDGKGVCTKLDCILLHSLYPNKTVCVPGSNPIFACNYCSCGSSNRGLYCDRMGCSRMDFYHENLLNVTVSCKADTKFDYNCHECQCDETGTYAMCNGKACPPEEDFVIEIDTVDECHPGMIFANNCNVCICNDDRKGTCTTSDCGLTYRFKYE